MLGDTVNTLIEILLVTPAPRPPRHRHVPRQKGGKQRLLYQNPYIDNAKNN
jgi:hypothetical protein